MRGQTYRPDSARDELPAAEGTVTDPSTLAPGQRLIYPGQGVCEITGVEAKEIAGQQLEMVRMRRLEDGAAVLVPKGKVASIGLRRLPTVEQVEGVFHYLGASYDAPELDWKTRHRDNADRLLLGGVLGVAEVVKGLNGLSQLRPLPTKERELYDHARHLLVAEISAALGVPPGIAEDYVDYALMPPAGVKFQLKPPPPPVLPPAKPRPRRGGIAEDLADLGLPDLELEEAEEEAEGEGEPSAAGGEEGEAEEAAPEEVRHPAAKAAAKAHPPARKTVAKKAAPKKHAPAKKAPPKKRAPAKPARGGKKK
ncbi:MAG TPA: CarD family transcriptional regulator [Anaeromyxobacteraceae bacterium]|nr:CarD family transcriptional regulator [Anaeromyxobacteraceae bacterium]